MKHRSIFSFILILVVTLNLFISALSPVPAQAAIKSTATSFSGCFVGNTFSAFLSGQIDRGLKILQDKIKNIGNKYVKELLGSFFGGLLGTNVPVQDKTSEDAAQSLLGYFQNKDYRDAIIARCMARQMMIGITENTLDIIRTGGRDGGPTYVKNWVNFQTAAQYRGENIVRAQLSTARLCDYLADDVKRSFGVDPKIKTPITGQNTRTGSLQPFNLATRCTLPEGFSMENYEKDFAGNGGWDTFARLLEPQNNISGLINITQDEMQKQRSLAVNADVNQAIANNGYLGVSGNGKADSCMVKSPIGDCLIYKDIKTPGSYIAQNVGATVTSEFQWLTSAQGLNSIIAFGTEVLLNRLLDFGNPDDGDYRWVNDADRQAAPSTSPSGPPPPPIFVIPCTVGNQGVSLKSAVDLAATTIDILKTNDFEDTLGSNDGDFKKRLAAANLDKVYIMLYDLEKTITDPRQIELKSSVQGWGSAIRGIAAAIPKTIWDTQAEKADIDRLLTGWKTSISEIKTQIDALIPCSSITQ